jgi:hypothetical protein
VVEDSNNVIRHMVLGTNYVDFRLAFMFVRIKQVMALIPSVKFDHVQPFATS